MPSSSEFGIDNAEENCRIMRKGLAIQALVFMFLSLFPYVHAQDRFQAHKTAQSQNPSDNAPAAVPQKANPAVLQQQTSAQQFADEPKSVRIIPSPKDKYDFITFGASIVLTAVGIFGVFAAIITLRKLERQTKGTEDAANAALKQIQLMKDKERAWITVEVLPIETLQFGSNHNRVMLKFSNIGVTHAFNVYAEGDARAIVFENTELMKGFLIKIPRIFINKPEFEPPPFELEDLLVPTVLQSGASYGDTWVAFIFPEEWQNAILLRPQIAIEVRGEIRYQDVFGDNHSTKFSYDVRISKWGEVSREGSAPIRPYSPFSQWHESGGEDGNRAT
jgi:hypothetical protein